MHKERYIPIRPGIQAHLIRGTISYFEFGVYVTVHLQADYSTGVWHGSAPRLLATAPRGASLRQIQRALEHLEDLNYLKSFRPNGTRGNTAYLIDKFTVRSGARSGYRLNVNLSTSWKQAVYEPVADDDAPDDVHDDALLRSKKEEVRRRHKPREAKPTSPPDPRFQSFVDHAFASFEQKHGQKPTWGSKDFQNLKTLLGKTEHLPVAELQRRWGYYLASTEPFTVKMGDSLAYFCAKFDSFIAGPICGPKEKIGASDAITISLRNSGLDENGKLNERPN